MKTRELEQYLIKAVKENKPSMFTTEEVINLLTENGKLKIVTCNACKHEFLSRRKDDSKIECPKCGFNKSLSILSSEREI